MQKCINDTVSAGLADLVKVGIEEKIATREITDRARGLKTFQEKYLSDLPKVDYGFAASDEKPDNLLYRMRRNS